MAHFQIPLDLPHAGRVAVRLLRVLEPAVDPKDPTHQAAMAACTRVVRFLAPHVVRGENPDDPEAEQTAAAAAELGRELVEELVAAKLTRDRVGQCIRNLFECLELGEEGARLSLRAGEDPRSLQRPS